VPPTAAKLPSSSFLASFPSNQLRIHYFRRRARPLLTYLFFRTPGVLDSLASSWTVPHFCGEVLAESPLKLSSHNSIPLFGSPFRGLTPVLRGEFGGFFENCVSRRGCTFLASDRASRSDEMSSSYLFISIPTLFVEIPLPNSAIAIPLSTSIPPCAGENFFPPRTSPPDPPL